MRELGASELRRVGETELRPVSPTEPDFERLVEIAIEAYEAYYPPPVLREAEIALSRAHLAALGPSAQMYGAYRERVPVGSMRLYDYTMRLRGSEVFVGGLGSVAVGLEHKRRGIARDMILGYLASYREREAPLAALYPFRPDFYRSFGFGYGAPMNRYSFAIEALPNDGARSKVRALSTGDAAAMLDSYHRMQSTTNGLFRRDLAALRRLLDDGAVRCFGFIDDDIVRGYVALVVRPGPSEITNRHELLARELVFETPAALTGLLAFVRSQGDQYARFLIATQMRDFHLLVRDPRDGTDRNIAPPVAHAIATLGLGIMYRVLDVPRLIESLGNEKFGDLCAKVAFEIRDNDVAANNAVHAFHFDDGHVESGGNAPDVTVALDIAEFSSLITGAVTLKSLVALGRATIDSREWLDRVDRALCTEPPQCMTRF